MTNYFDMLFEHNPQPMWIFDLRSFRPLAVNDSALRLYGCNEHASNIHIGRGLCSNSMSKSLVIGGRY